MSEMTQNPIAGVSCVGMQDRARELARRGRDVIHLDRGELDFNTPQVVIDAAVAALRENRTRYGDSSGSPELRAAICQHYARAYGVEIRPSQVLVHAGSSPLLLHLFLTVVGPGDEVVLPDPGYPGYATCVRAVRGVAKQAPAGDAGFSYRAADAARHITAATKAVVVNSPCNPTGSVLSAAELARFSGLGPLVISDEAYHGLLLDGRAPHSMLEFSSDAVVVNSFSKAYAMTGWRLGYLIGPRELVASLEPLQRDCVISPNTFVQDAGVVALSDATSFTTMWRDELRRRRDVLVAGLTKIGLEVPCHPSGGFYAFARLPDGYDSAQFASRLLQEEAVAVVSGHNFGPAGRRHIRCSFAPRPERLEAAVSRIAAFLDRR